MKHTQTAARWEAFILVIAVAHILAYALLVPVWRHYDEPTSLEYALLIRDLGRIPTYDEYLPEQRMQIVASLQRSPLFAELIPSNIPDEIPDIGFNQRVHPPLYYSLIALILLPARDSPLEVQLVLARLGSVAISAICFYLALHVLRLLITKTEVRIFVALMLALLPPFADIMSAVNSDVLANTFAVALFGLALNFLQQPTWRTFWPVLTIALISPGVKRILIFPALLTLGTILLFWSRPSRKLLWTTLVAVLVIGISLLNLLPQRLADWHVLPPDTTVTASNPEGHRHNQRSFMLERPAMSGGPMIEQFIDPQRVYAARGRIVTISARVRTSSPGLMISTPVLQIDQKQHKAYLVGHPGWHNVHFSAHVPPDARQIIVRLHGPYNIGAVWYDDLALVLDHAPSTLLPDGIMEVELLPNEEAQNLIRNPSAERYVPDLAQIAPDFVQPWLAQRTVDQMITRIFDPTWQRTVYPLQFRELFRGFWGVFSWGEVSVRGGWLISIALVVTSSLIGASIVSLRLARGGTTTLLYHQQSWWLCLAFVVGVWALAMIRVTLQPIPGVVIWSFGRYTYPAVLPGLAVLAIGLATILPKHLRLQGLVGVGLFFVVYALVHVVQIMALPVG